MQRSAGVLLHPTCLPSQFGIGDIGPTAHRYVEWLSRAGVGWWQVLPLHPPGPGESPYSATSSFAGNPLLVSPEALVAEGLLVADAAAVGSPFPDSAVDFAQVVPWKSALLERAYERFVAAPPGGMAEDLARFRESERAWLGEYALFAALKQVHGGAPWYEWPEELARHDTEAVARWRREHEVEVGRVEYAQFLFARQWASLRETAAARGVRILGDVPIFVAYDSADVWAHRHLFLLDERGRPTVVAGVPPDYFSPTGQLWGNPLYDWERMVETGFAWWIERLRHTLRHVDAVRLDHFRGFAAHWEVPAGDEVATNGRWVPGPGKALFDALREALGGLPLVAEDLGEITPDVIALRKELGLPGMAILHFGFSPDPRSTFIPYAHERDLVVYTGTHDNNTTVGWFREDASDQERELFLSYAASDGSAVHWDMVRLALASVADLAVVPHQDLAGLGSEARMNTPSVALGNWGFRLMPEMMEEQIQRRLAEMVRAYGR